MSKTLNYAEGLHFSSAFHSDKCSHLPAVSRSYSATGFESRLLKILEVNSAKCAEFVMMMYRVL